jgi:hypothetical protein
MFTDPTNGWRKYADESAWIDWWITTELVKVPKHGYHSALFMHKVRDQYVSKCSCIAVVPECTCIPVVPFESRLVLCPMKESQSKTTLVYTNVGGSIPQSVLQCCSVGPRHSVPHTYLRAWDRTPGTLVSSVSWRHMTLLPQTMRSWAIPLSLL